MPGCSRLHSVPAGQWHELCAHAWPLQRPHWCGNGFWALGPGQQQQHPRGLFGCLQARVIFPTSLACCPVLLTAHLPSLHRWPVFVKNVTEDEDWGWPHLGIGCGAAEGCFVVTDPATGRGTKFWVRDESWQGVHSDVTCCHAAHRALCPLPGHWICSSLAPSPPLHNL
jgi:hypothetical protein